LYASVIIVLQIKKHIGKNYMQNTKYENVVIATIQNLAALVSNAAHDSKLDTVVRENVHAQLTFIN
jgi:hypothetical protein